MTLIQDSVWPGITSFLLCRRKVGLLSRRLDLAALHLTPRTCVIRPELLETDFHLLAPHQPTNQESNAEMSNLHPPSCTPGQIGISINQEIINWLNWTSVWFITSQLPLKLTVLVTRKPRPDNDGDAIPSQLEKVDGKPEPTETFIALVCSRFAK